MTTNRKPAVPTGPAALDDLRVLAPLWLDDLGYEHSRETVRSYRASANNFIGFLLANDLPPTAGTITSTHVKRFLTCLRESNYAPATVHKHYAALAALFKYALAEEIVLASPMAPVSPPRIPARPVPIVSRDILTTLLNTCRGKDFLDRRDTAIIVFLLDTGSRASEICGLRLSDVDLVTRTVVVTGKGNRTRHLAPGTKNMKALAQYLRVRAGHPKAATSDALWLGHRGPLGTSGLRRMLDRRCVESGIQGVNPHRFRHTFAHNWLAANLGETNLMYLAGWRSRDMLSRYAASSAEDRARQAQIASSPTDRILS